MATSGELWGTLTGLNVTYAQRWLSAWADLLLADMALMEHQKLEPKPSNMFHRRALWESAVVSYGRFGFSEQKRPISPKEFVEEVTGTDGLALHERLMDWRHGHVAHRRDSEFESVETVLAFPGESTVPHGIRVVLGIDCGPGLDGDFIGKFQSHIKTLRDAMYEKRLRGFGIAIKDDLDANRIAQPTELRSPPDQATLERYVINLCLLGLNPDGSIT